MTAALAARGHAGPAQAPPAPSRGGDVVFTFSYVSWQAAAQRGWFMPEDRLAAALASDPRVGRVLIADMMRSLPVRLLRDAACAVSRRAHPFPGSDSAQLLRPVRLRREYPASPRAVERAVRRYEHAIERHAARMGMRHPTVITANPLLAGFGRFGWAGPVTFFATDDWLAYEPHRRWWRAYEESFRRVHETGRRVCAVSPAALERINPTGPALVVPNGLDPAEWQGVPAAPPAWSATSGRPLLLYVGSLDDRLDVAALSELARAMPSATVALVGPLLDAAHLRPLSALANVEIHPPLGRPQIAALIRVADAGLIPHVSSPLTRAMSPLKLYEYLAGGLPVVAADLPGVRGVHNGVVLVRPGTSYLEATRAALARGRATERERLAFIEANSWRARQETLLDLALAPEISAAPPSAASAPAPPA